jgi:predicted tellurium resistance membrane protein TerC
MHELLTVENLIALLTLTSLEIVLGIDNIVFIAILTGKVEPARRAMVRTVGMGLAMGMRILLLLGIKWIMQLTEPLFAVAAARGVRARPDPAAGWLVPAGQGHLRDSRQAGGARATSTAPARAHVSVPAILAQIIAIDLVFSLDSVITAVGMAQEVSIMIIAVVIAVLVMMLFAGSVSTFVERHPTIKMLALSFLLHDRRDAGGGRAGSSHRARLCLFRHGLLAVRGDSQHPQHPQAGGRGPRELRPPPAGS